MKGSGSFVFRPDTPVYIIRIKSGSFPWWLLLIPLSLFVLLIKCKEKVDVAVVDKESKKPIKNADVTVEYLVDGNKQKQDARTDANGVAVFVLNEYRLYQRIAGNVKIDGQLVLDFFGKKEKYDSDKLEGLKYSDLNSNAQKAILRLDPEEETPQVDEKSIINNPVEGSRAFFTGLIVGGKYKAKDISKVYQVDQYSEYVGVGEYPDNEKAFPNAVKYTFDGIAIDKGTRVIIYSEKNFKGEVLLDRTGPAIINNVKWKDDKRYRKCNTDDFPEPLQTNFPQAVREWSQNDMHSWSYGSVKVLSSKNGL